MPLYNHFIHISQALHEDQQAYDKGEVPVGAIVLSKEGIILANEYNKKESTFDPCGHAEILAIKSAAKKINRSSTVAKTDQPPLWRPWYWLLCCWAPGARSLQKRTQKSRLRRRVPRPRQCRG